MRMCIVLSTLWLAGLALAGHPKHYKIVCYVASWAVYRTGNTGEFAISDIDPTLCTHLIYAFVGITEDGGVEILDEFSDLPYGGGKDGFGEFIGLKTSSQETKFMVSIGGWNQGSVTYSNVVGNSSLRSNFVESVVNFTLTYGFDGFDIVWEYPNQRNGTEADVENFVLLLKELRAVFDENDLILSVAVAAAESSARLSYNISGISEYVDFINLMTYEYHGSWDSTTGHNTPLYSATRETAADQGNLNINASVHYWLEQGAPREKLVLGTAAHGKSFTLSNSSQGDPGSPAIGGGNAGEYSQENGILFYYEICTRILNDGWTNVWDKEQFVPYTYLGNQWISYDNAKSITKKAKYIKKMGLGGAMIWTIDQDDPQGVCGKSFPLLTTLNHVLPSSLRNFGSNWFEVIKIFMYIYSKQIIEMII